jgi:hypothetical protein
MVDTRHFRGPGCFEAFEGWKTIRVAGEARSKLAVTGNVELDVAETAAVTDAEKARVGRRLMLQSPRFRAAILSHRVSNLGISKEKSTCADLCAGIAALMGGRFGAWGSRRRRGRCLVHGAGGVELRACSARTDPLAIRPVPQMKDYGVTYQPAMLAPNDGLGGWRRGVRSMRREAVRRGSTRPPFRNARI